MKTGYISELNARKKLIDAGKAGLEAWYGANSKIEEKLVVGDKKAAYDAVIAAAETAIQSGQGTLISIRKAVAP